jgi:hypothetical protein
MQKQQRPGAVRAASEADRSALARVERSKNYSGDLSSATSIYNGRTLLGWIVSRGERFEAIIASRQSLGLYNTAVAARNAVAHDHLRRPA